MRISDLLGDEPDDEGPDGGEDEGADGAETSSPGVGPPGERSLTEILEEASGAAAAASEGGTAAPAGEPPASSQIPEVVPPTPGDADTGPLLGDLEPGSPDGVDDVPRPSGPVPTESVDETEAEFRPDPPAERDEVAPDTGPAAHTAASVFGGGQATGSEVPGVGAGVLTRAIEPRDDDLLPTVARTKPTRAPRKQAPPPAPEVANAEAPPDPDVAPAEPTRRERRAARSGGAADRKAARKADKEQKKAERAAAKAEHSAAKADKDTASDSAESGASVPGESSKGESRPWYKKEISFGKKKR